MDEISRLLLGTMLTILLLFVALLGGPVVCFVILAAHICLKEKPAEKSSAPGRQERGGTGRPLAERLINSRSAAEFIERL